SSSWGSIAGWKGAVVSPAQAGIPDCRSQDALDSRLRGNDGFRLLGNEGFRLLGSDGFRLRGSDAVLLCVRIGALRARAKPQCKCRGRRPPPWPPLPGPPLPLGGLPSSSELTSASKRC